MESDSQAPNLALIKKTLKQFVAPPVDMCLDYMNDRQVEEVAVLSRRYYGTILLFNASYDKT
jgi:hypothetical protein